MRNTLTLKYGEEILAGPYPKSMAEFIGQETARLELTGEVTSALLAKRPVGHILLASGLPGIGKTTLARLTAHMMGAGLADLGGVNVRAEDAVTVVRQMSDGDVLFLDEVHLLVAGGKNKADWLLTLLQDGMIQTRRGAVQAPKITVIAATTDPMKLPRTILDRFRVQPLLKPYQPDEAAGVARMLAQRLGFGVELPVVQDQQWFRRIAAAADFNPRTMGRLLEAVRRSYALNGEIFTEGAYDLTQALVFTGLTADGLTRGQVKYLTRLHTAGGTASQATLKALLRENDFTYDEGGLLERGLVEICPGGRTLTDWGEKRAKDLLHAEQQQAQVLA